MSRADRGGLRALRPAYRPSRKACGRRPGWWVGREDVIERLRALESEYPGLEHVVLHWPEGMSADEWIAQLRMFARDVMPAFSARVPEKVGV